MVQLCEIFISFLTPKKYFRHVVRKDNENLKKVNLFVKAFGHKKKKAPISSLIPPMNK